MKRALSLSFLLFANIFVLVHLVVPHHYHENTGVCFSLHCQDSKEAHRHEPIETQTHKHDGNPFSDECSIDIIYAPADKNEKYVFLHVKSDLGYILIADSYFVENSPVYFRQNSYAPIFYTDYISQSLGLRAPPIS